MQKTFLSNGRLIIPAEGRAPRLFLEWIANQRLKSIEINITYRYCKEGSTKLYDFYDESYYAVLCILLDQGDNNGIVAVKQYINDNNR